MTLSKESVRTIIGIIGNVVSFFLFASPAPTIYEIHKRKAVEDFSVNPYLATVMNCALWVFYGMPFVHPHSTLVYTINSVGLVIEFCYIAVYFWYANKQQRNRVVQILLAELVFFVGIVLATLLSTDVINTRTLIVGICCLVFNILMYAMPLDNIFLVIRTKSVEYLPFYLLCCNFANGLIWLSYALLRFDLFITISNGAGAICGLIQLILYAWYYKSTPKNKDHNPAKAQGDVQLSNV